MIKEKELDDGVIKQLWNVASQRVPNVDVDHVRQAIVILGMAGRGKPDIIQENVGLLVAIGAGPLTQETLLITRDACMALKQLTGPKKATL